MRSRLLFGLLTLLAAGPTLGSTSSVSIGTGPSSIVELDNELRPLRRWVGLDRPSDVTVLDDGGLLVADAGVHEVIAIGADGAVLWREHYSDGVQRVRPRPAGGLVVTSIDRILLTDAARKVVRAVPLPGVRAALELPNGAVLAAYNSDGQGWLVEIAPDGSVGWRSLPRTADGASTPAGDGLSFLSVSALDVAADGTIFLTDFDAHALLLLDRDRRLQRRWSQPGGGHWSDTKIGPAGELMMTSPESAAFFLESGATGARGWTSTTTELPMCADVGPDGHVFVCLLHRPEASRLNATLQREAARARVPFHRSLPGGAILGGTVALLLAALLRWPELRTVRPAEPRYAERPRPGSEIAPPPASWMRRLMVGGWIAALVAALFVGWKSAAALPRGPATRDLVTFFGASVVAGVALRVLNGLCGVSATLSSFSGATLDTCASGRRANGSPTADA